MKTPPDEVPRRPKIPYEWEVRRAQRRRKLFWVWTTAGALLMTELVYLIFAYPA
jgi:hypothetical protein